MKPSTIANIQQAGAWLRDAAQSLAKEASIRQARVTEVLASDAFNAATDAHFDDWKSVARIAQTVTALELQLKQVYLVAMGVGSEMPFKETPLLASSSTSSVDIVDVPVRKAKRTPRARQTAVADTGAQAAANLTGNTAKAYAFLKSKVADDGVAHVTQAEISQGASIAEGSVSFAISSLKKKGLVDESERGHYRLS